MPGIIGIAEAVSSGASAAAAAKMQDAITHIDFHVRDILFSDGKVSAARTHIGISNKQPQPFVRDGLHIWLDGEIYNREEVASNHSLTCSSDAELICGIFSDGSFMQALEEIDGFFSAAIYDSRERKIYLLSDRYGMRQLYFTADSKRIAWSSEVKSFLHLPGFSPVIDPQSVLYFTSVGYILDDKTWFKSVRLVPPGTVMKWDIKTGRIETRSYWWWDHIRRTEDKVNPDEAAEELGRLFISSVKRRCRENETVGLTLSGGLDSRALLAAIPDSADKLNAITFGSPGCDDIRIASEAARIRGAKHHVIEINSSNWIEKRLETIWRTDGQLNWLHMHAVIMMDRIRDLYKVNMNGFAGDLVLGGSYLTKDFLAGGNRKNAVAAFMNCPPDLLSGYDAFSSLSSSDFYFIQNRVRRFTYEGTRVFLPLTEQRKPFFDNKLIEFTYSLPDELRYKSRLYNKMLLMHFPEYFRTLPWQKTGLPISTPEDIVRAVVLARRVKNRAIRELGRTGIHIGTKQNYTDYANWMRSEPARPFITSVLEAPGSVYPEYVDKQKVLSLWANHLAGRDCQDKVALFLTFEIFLQQVFNGKYM